MEQKVQKEEENLVNLDVIEAVSDDIPTIWCSNPVLSPKKNGEIVMFKYESSKHSDSMPKH